MNKVYRTTKGTIIAEEVENADIKVKLLTDLDKKEYVMVKRQNKIELYNLSLLGYVIEIDDDISFEEFRDITYAKLDQELLDQGIKPKRMDYKNFQWQHIKGKDSTSS